MAFSFGNVGSSLGSQAAAGLMTQGPDLEIISTEGLGFLNLAGDAKVQLTSQWSPAPSSHASLLSVASRKGLVAAAGPDALTLATTEAVRKTFEKEKDGDDDIRSFQPQVKLPLPTRICQLAFTADENFLVISAEQGGGLAVYDVKGLLQGSIDTAFSIPTNGEALRALVPNPSTVPEMAELCALVTEKGNLLMVNMKERGFVSGSNGQILRTQVSCAAWSKKGKQLVAGLGDGTMIQMTPKGEVKAEIPRPAGLDPNYFVSFLAWLENDLFLAIHISTAEQTPSSKYHLITRQGQSFTSQKLNDPVDPFGSDKVPHHTAVRLSNFQPNLTDLLVFSSTATPDIGLLSRSKTPLSSEHPAEKLTNVFTTTELADDSRRATLPMGMSGDAVPVGTALDLSSKDLVYRPIPADEIDQSAGPLPGYWVLNDEGVLSVWWIVYSESIRAGSTYSEITAATESQPSAMATETSKPVHSNPFGATTASPFGASTATSSPFGAPKASPFGAPAAAAAPFGAPSIWGSQPTTGTSTFGQPSFGSSTFGQPSQGPAPSFGQLSGLGTRSSPWGTASAAASSPAFGQSGFASAAKGPSPFASPSPGNNVSGGFASFASGNGFASLAPKDNKAGNDSASIFSSEKAGTPEVSMETDANTSFPPPPSKPTGNTNVFGSTPFKLTSSFQPDPKAKEDEAANDGSKTSGGSMFGSAFASAMGEATKLSSSSPFGQTLAAPQSTTPTTTPAPPKFLSHTSTAPPSGGIFDLPRSTALFGTPSTQTPKSTSLFGTPTTQTAPKINIEAGTPKGPSDAPLPPDTTSKATYPFGESPSSSEISADSLENNKIPSGIPLPFDSTSSKKNAEETPDSHPGADDAPLPPDPTTNKKLYANLPPLSGEPTQLKPIPKAVDTSKPVNDVKSPPLPAEKSMPKPVDLKPVPGSTQQPSKPASIFDDAGPKASGGFIFPSNPPPVSDSEEDEDEDGDDAAATSEGSGVDVAKDLSPPSAEKSKTPGFTPQSSFDGLGGSFSTISQPDQQPRNLFGEISRGMPMFPRPNPVSPRSPSPVRGAVPPRMIGNEQRSFSAPGMASQILGASKRPQSRLGPGAGAPIVGKIIPTEDSRIEQQRQAKARKDMEESQLLVDEEDDLKQDLLRAPIQPTLQLDEFIAHSGPATPASDNIPAQVEAVYRDINAMIDTLGINARAVTNFIEGHARAFIHEHLDQEDLVDNPDDWTLGDLKALSRIVGQEMLQQLEISRVKDVEEMISQCQELLRDLARDRSRRDDMEKLILARLGIDNERANKTLPLSTEQAAQQADMRRELNRVLKLLAEAEEALTMLRTKIASVGTANGKGSQPTIEAIMRTIAKMTTMAEKRSVDIDVLENQMRKLRFSSPVLGASTRSREGSPFATPKSKLGSSLMFSPERSMRESTPTQRTSVMRHSMSASVSSIGGGMFAVRTPPRKKLIGYTEEEAQAIKNNKDKRNTVLHKLKGSVERRGAVIQSLDVV